MRSGRSPTSAASAGSGAGVPASRAAPRGRRKSPRAALNSSRRSSTFWRSAIHWFDYPLDGNGPSLLDEHRDCRSTLPNWRPAAARSQLRALRPGDDRGPHLREPEPHHRCRDGPEPVGEWRARRDPCFDGRRRPGRRSVRHLSRLPGLRTGHGALAGSLDSVSASYTDLFALRDAIAPGKPVIGHCYDYAIPNGVAPICAGPWLLPSLEFAGYDPAEGLNIVSAIIDRFYTTMQGLAAVPKNNFVLIDTRNTLAQGRGRTRTAGPTSFIPIRRVSFCWRRNGWLRCGPSFRQARFNL